MNLIEPMLHYAERCPDQTALSHGGISLTYSALMERVRQVAHGLIQQGARHGKIALLSSNRPEFAEVFLGAVYAGCVPVLMDPKWSEAEIQGVLQQCEPHLLFTEAELIQRIGIQEARVQVLVFSDDGTGTGAYHTWRDSFQPKAELDVTNELLFIGFTSGTTGLPKGFMRTHASWITSFEAAAEAFDLEGAGHVLAPGPFVHSLSLFALMQSLYIGATFHSVQQFEAREVLKLCTTVPGMVLFVVPTMIEAMMQYAVPGETPIQALISSGGKWTEVSKERCSEIFNGVQLYEYYGSSEASYISYMDVYGDHKPGSIGRPFDGVEISVRDEHFQALPAGSVGQLYVRSGMTFLGYYGRPEETAAVFHDGWLKLGDFVSVDADGYLHLAGRANNMIVTGGLNVFPEEVEAVLQRHPAVREVMVYGVPDEYWGERIVVAVVWNGQERLTIEELKEHCRHHLASHKAPKQLIEVEQFLYTSSGKLARHDMKEYMKRVMT